MILNYFDQYEQEEYHFAKTGTDADADADATKQSKTLTLKSLDNEDKTFYTPIQNTKCTYESEYDKFLDVMKIRLTNPTTAVLIKAQLFKGEENLYELEHFILVGGTDEIIQYNLEGNDIGTYTLKIPRNDKNPHQYEIEVKKTEQMPPLPELIQSKYFTHERKVGLILPNDNLDDLELFTQEGLEKSLATKNVHIIHYDSILFRY